MGHLDPFFQELNGIGILALIITIIAVIVRVVFCKTMRARIYTGVLGLISAIVMSLGIDYAIRPFAGTGESTATNGLGFVQLMIGVVIALIGGAVLRGILSHDDGEPQPTSNSLIVNDRNDEHCGLSLSGSAIDVLPCLKAWDSSINAMLLVRASKRLRFQRYVRLERLAPCFHARPRPCRI